MNFSLFGLVVAVYAVSSIYSGLKKHSKSTGPSKQIKQAGPNQKIKQSKPHGQTKNKKIDRSVPSKSELIKEILVTMDSQDQNSFETPDQPTPSKDENLKEGTEIDKAVQEDFEYSGVRSPLDSNWSVSLDLDSKEELAKAIILKEILDPPLSMRCKRSRD